MSVPRRQRIRRQRIRRAIARVGIRRLLADARQLSDGLPEPRAARLQASIERAGDDGGVAVWEWYEEHAPARLYDVTEGHWR